MGGDGLQPRRRRRGRETHYNFFAKKDGGGRKGGKCQRGPSSSAVVVTRLSYVERSSNVTPSGERTYGVKAGFGGGGRGKAPGADLASINNTLPLSVPLCEVAHYYTGRRGKEGSPLPGLFWKSGGIGTCLPPLDDGDSSPFFSVPDGGREVECKHLLLPLLLPREQSLSPCSFSLSQH